jgi:threonylcarbamoyladenosine tRNA methylthiotransferase MtaB
MKKVAFQTLGCKLNFAESSTIGRQFIERGFSIVNPDQPSDVFVLNTCTVTQKAECECRRLIRRILRNHPETYIIVAGCYSQLQAGEIAKINGVDLILGGEEKFHLLDFAGKFRKSSSPGIFISRIDQTEDIHTAYSSDVGGRTRAFLKIQDGCDYNCSFCTIPKARGLSRSLPIQTVVDQAQEIIKQGHREIVLTGVNVGDYGRKNGAHLLGLMKDIEKLDGIERVRISSIEPNLLTQETVDFVLRSNKFCKHFHIPLQSGSNPVLKRMRRRYTAESYRSLIEYINKNDPDAGIGIDVIAGFPGETDTLFAETVSFLENLQFSYIHAFTYSERPGTPATDYAEKIPPSVRHSRNEALRSIGKKKRTEFMEKFIGKSPVVLFENSKHDGFVSGLTSNYIRISAEGDASLINQLRCVTITKIHDDSCAGFVSKNINIRQTVPEICIS